MSQIISYISTTNPQNYLCLINTIISIAERKNISCSLLNTCSNKSSDPDSRFYSQKYGLFAYRLGTGFNSILGNIPLETNPTMEMIVAISIHLIP